MHKFKLAALSALVLSFATHAAQIVTPENYARA